MTVPTEFGPEVQVMAICAHAQKEVVKTAVNDFRPSKFSTLISRRGY